MSEGTELLLFAEDEVLVRGFAVHVLRSLDYKVIVAKDGRQALGIVKQMNENG